MLAKAGQEGVSHVDEVTEVVSSAVRHYGDDAVSAIPESRRAVGAYWLDDVRKQADIKWVDDLKVIAEYDAVKNVIEVNPAEFLKLNKAQQVTVIFHELWHHKVGLTKLFANNTWLGGPVTVIDNEDPPQPLGPGVKYTSWLLLAEQSFKRTDGREVQLYRLTPIYRDERDLERRSGPPALLRAFDRFSVPLIVDMNRPSVVK